MPKNEKATNEPTSRPPIVVIMGHIDHGKSTLLDYIRKTNIVEKEAGGITQHLSAYVVEHKMKDTGEAKHITFLDTPGHEAFQKMRLRGAEVADIAVLVVSAEEGVKPQTIEALNSIKAANIPYIVAINKIDKPNANIVRTQASLVENEIYIEGMGGDIPFVAISAKTGENIEELLEVLLLAAELAELTGDPHVSATGIVIEASLEPKRGTSATLIIKNGTLESGNFIVSGTTWAPVRIMENFAGKTIKSAGLSEPVRIVGFSGVPSAGDTFYTVPSKKEAEASVQKAREGAGKISVERDNALPRIPVMIKADVLGSIEAIEHEIAKFISDRVFVDIVGKGVGTVNENDVKNTGATKNAIIVGFNVGVDRAAVDLAERLGVEIQTFDIIYKLAEWLKDALVLRTPKFETEEKTGEAKILKHFSTQKYTHVLGGRVLGGTLSVDSKVKIFRRDLELGTGSLRNLQQQKANVNSVSDGEFGMQLDTKVEMAAGDTIAAFKTVIS